MTDFLCMSWSFLRYCEYRQIHKYPLSWLKGCHGALGDENIYNFGKFNVGFVYLKPS